MVKEETTAFPEMTVFIVDDDTNMRKSLERLCIQHALSVQSFASAAEILNVIDQKSLGCLLLDIVMPNVNGLELQKQLTNEKIDLPIIFLTGHADVAKAVQAFKQGAVEFIEKPFNNMVLLEAIYEALTQLQQKQTIQADRQNILALRKNLTSRENEVLNEIMNGLSNKEIAKQFTISPRTIESHRTNIMRKMEASSAVDLVHRMNISNS